MDLGRKQVGQTVPLRLKTFDQSGGPMPPDAAPMAVLTYPNASTSAPMKMAMDRGPKAFKLDLPLGVQLPLGSYFVTYTYSVGGFPRQATDSFELIAGGDPGGQVISMASHGRPEAQYVVVQLSSGRIVQGRNPKL